MLHNWTNNFLELSHKVRTTDFLLHRDYADVYKYIHIDTSAHHDMKQLFCFGHYLLLLLLIIINQQNMSIIS